MTGWDKNMNLFYTQASFSLTPFGLLRNLPLICAQNFPTEFHIVSYHSNTQSVLILGQIYTTNGISALY
jgi:hypothetical protein